MNNNDDTTIMTTNKNTNLLSNDDHHHGPTSIDSLYEDNDAQYERDIDRRLFQFLDINRDGILTPQDIQHSLRALHLPYTDTYVKEVFDSIIVTNNTNNNNNNNNNDNQTSTTTVSQLEQQQQQKYITYDQFQTYVKTKYKQLKDLFHQFDTNRNGKIERHEVESMLTKLNVKHTSNDVKRIMKLMDRDNDGTIGFSEFCDLLMILPVQNVEQLLESWMEAAAFDIEDGVIAPASVTNASSVMIHLVAGALSGAASRTGTAPFERLKILYQIQTKVPPSLWQGFKLMYKDGGMWGLWRGNGVNVLKIVPESALRWVLFEAAKTYFSKASGEAQRPPTPYELFLSGSVAGCISHTALYPLEVIKTRITASESSLGLFKTIRKINVEEGRVLPYFKGLSISLASVVPLSGVNLAIYEMVKRFFVDDQPGKEPGVLGLLAAGSISSTFSQTLFYPMHTIKARLIIQNHGLGELSTRTYKNTWDVVAKTIKHEGFWGMYKGYVPSLLKAVPAHCIAFVSYEATKSALLDMTVSDAQQTSQT